MVTVFVDRDSLQLVFRHLDAERVDPVELLVALERADVAPAKLLVEWLADRSPLDSNPERRIVAALVTRAVGVRHDSGTLLELGSPPRDPWGSAKRIALRLDPLDRPYLDVDVFVDAFGASFERSVRDWLLAARFRREPRHLYAVLAAMPEGFELAARLLDDMTLGTDQIVALVMVMFEQDRRASLRWLARRSRQPQLLPALQRVVRELERQDASADFVAEARKHVALEPRVEQPAEIDLTTRFRRVFDEGGAEAFVRAAQACEGIRPPGRTRLRWMSRRAQRFSSVSSR